MESLEPQPKPTQDTSRKKRKNPYNTMEDITNMKYEMHDAKTMFEEIIMETSYWVNIEGLDEMEVEEKTLLEILPISVFEVQMVLL